MGPFHNRDTQWEYQAASGVIRWGMPYDRFIGNLIDQPPLGFYVEALFLKIFGISLDTGVALVTLFGIGSTVLVYKIGKILYSKTTGVFAALLFALTPWQLVLFEKLSNRRAMSVLQPAFSIRRNLRHSQRFIQAFRGFGDFLLRCHSDKVLRHFCPDSTGTVLQLLWTKEPEKFIQVVGSVFLARIIICFLVVSSNFRKRAAFHF